MVNELAGVIFTENIYRILKNGKIAFALPLFLQMNFFVEILSLLEKFSHVPVDVKHGLNF